MSLSPNAVLALASRHGLALATTTLHLDESGLDFQVALAQTQDNAFWLLRIPRRPDVLASAQREQVVLNLVRPDLPIQVPDWQIHTDELIAYPLLWGKPAGTIDPERQNYCWEVDPNNLPDAYLQSLGMALSALHRIEPGVLARGGLDTPAIAAIRTAWSERMARVKQVYPVNPQLWERWQRWLDNDTLWPEHTTLIHGDLHPGHILVDEQAQVTGLIDWTEARVDDPASDFAAHYRVFGRSSLEALLRHYDQSGGHVWPAMADHIVAYDSASAVEVAEFAERSGLDDFKAMARQMLSAESPSPSQVG
ncbi:macrolide 2'-phosphotransferase [Nodosilinea sp. P-1105]|uniref:macrolide 2'-phosphotransferase n=1 Tax=Nodosilinea sp. P-1105 TaxID=2546229 RepID=UPI00146C4257|nr:macrolide 2'-phosphotransferase [Nodosilinea sp. P-1105]NMF86223.1 macrolide 2'-phosphotransferase [Nodosilinea sp. P-1105]